MTAADTAADTAAEETGGELAVVEPGVEVVDRRDAAVEAAADAAMAMPGVPGRDEFLALAMQARMLSMSGAAPKLVRNNPYVAFHVAMVGRDLGISPSAALNLIDVIDTKNGPQLSLSPQLLNGQIRRLGLGSIRPVVQERDRCVAAAYGPDGVLLGETEFTWGDAQDAGLAGPNCQPGQHQETTRQRSADRGGGSYKTCGCNQGYRTYPRRMMWWRAAGFCAADYFPEAGMGLYSPEELGAVIDVEGRPVDPATVALPPGYDDLAEAAREQDQRQAQRQAAQDRPAAAQDLYEVQLQIGALPDTNRRALADAYKAHEKMRAYRVSSLPQRLLPTLRAMVRGHWAHATKDGHDRDQCVEAYRRRVAHTVSCITWLGPIDPFLEPRDRADDPTEPTAPQPGGGRALDWTGSGAPDAQEPLDGPPSPESPGEPATGHTEPEEVRDWVSEQRQLAEEVRALSAALPSEVALRIGKAVEAMHHTAVNRVLAGVEELAELFPPDSPISYRRMGAVYTLGTAFQETGEIPAAVTEAEAKQQA